MDLSPWLPNHLGTMGTYRRGDVLLAPVRISMGGDLKVRPVVVLGSQGRGEIAVLPVSGTRPHDCMATPLGIHEFAEGGLDLLGESYLLEGPICRIQVSTVLGKKGRLTPDAIRDLLPAPGVEREDRRDPGTTRGTRRPP